MDLVVGRVVKAHGVTGELVVDIRTDDPDLRFAPGSSLRGRPSRGGPESRYVVESAREHSGRLLVRLDGIADRSAADAMRGIIFLVDTEELPPIEQQADQRHGGPRRTRDQQLTLIARELRNQPIRVQIEPHYRLASSRERSAAGTSLIDAAALACSARK